MKKPLSSLDLNLLLCLQLLTQELSVTRTAKRMNVSPSAVSKSLAKLRAWFDDPLFVKTRWVWRLRRWSAAWSRIWRTGCRWATRSSINHTTPCPAASNSSWRRKRRC
ncbi:LysR family transcriptional regulator [Klebsiella variicola subsp. variicola]|nr:LysR family transcriptional regulator [Klebsiella variicola subsp. variicola]